MNTTRYWRCRNCGTINGCSLIILDDVEKWCYRCASYDLEFIADLNPNDPRDQDVIRKLGISIKGAKIRI